MTLCLHVVGVTLMSQSQMKEALSDPCTLVLFPALLLDGRPGSESGWNSPLLLSSFANGTLRTTEYARGVGKNSTPIDVRQSVSHITSDDLHCRAYSGLLISSSHGEVQMHERFPSSYGESVSSPTGNWFSVTNFIPANDDVHDAHDDLWLTMVTPCLLSIY